MQNLHKIAFRILFLLLIFSSAAGAESQSSTRNQPSSQQTANAKADGKNIAVSQTANAEATLTNQDSVNNIPGYSDTEWPEFDDAEAWLGTANSRAATDENTQFLLNSHQNRPGSSVSKDDPFMVNAFSLYDQNPEDFLSLEATDQYNDCTQQGGQQTVDTVYGVQCDRSRELIESTCQYGPAVVVDEDYIYDCDVVREYGEEYCEYNREVTVDEDFEYSCVESATETCEPDSTRRECDPDTTTQQCDPDTTRRECGPDTTRRICSTTRVCEPDTTQRVCTSQPDKRVCTPPSTTRVCDTRTNWVCPFGADYPCNQGGGRICRKGNPRGGGGKLAYCEAQTEQYNCRNETTPEVCRNVAQPDVCRNETVPGACRNDTTCRYETVPGTCQNVTIPGQCRTITVPGQCRNVTVKGECRYEWSNSCEAFDEGAKGCTEEGTICTQYDGGQCIQRAVTYLCEESVDDSGSNITLTDTIKEEAGDIVDDSVCGDLDADGTCSHTATTCTDADTTKVINGLPVYRDCWAWRKNYTCATDDYENHCTGLEGPQACSSQGETCADMGSDGVCNEFVRTFRCEDATEESEHVRLVSTPSDVVSDTMEGTCGDLESNPDCNKVGEVCTEPAETRTIDGVEIYKDCWRYEDSYQCVGPNWVDNCQDVSDTCTETGRTCLSRNNNGECTSETVEFDCPEQTSVDTPQVLTCPSNLYCLDGDCEELVEDPSPDFPEGVTYLNIIKGIQDELDPTNPDVFGAEPATCSRAVLGVVNCCNEGGSGLLNPIFGCSETEKALWQQVEDGKTVYVGTYCSAKALFVCTKKRKSYCVFDSKLGRIIQEQGREQLGIDWSTAPEDADRDEKAENPDCRGLTVPELQRIDFSKIDFSEVISEFMENIQLPDVNATADLVQQRVNSFYGN